MCCGNEELSGIMVSISRGAGTCVGTVAAAGKKITGLMAGGVTAAGRLLTRPVETPELIAVEQTESTSEEFGIRAGERQADQEKSAKSLISVLESDLASARGQLQELQSKAEEAQSQIASQLGDLQLEKESLLTELEQARSQANEAAIQASEAKTQAAVLEILETNLAAAQQHNLEKSRKEDQGVKPQPPSEMSPVQTEQGAGLPKPVEEVVVGAAGEKNKPSTETATVGPAEQVSLRTEEQPSYVISEGRMPSPAAVTDEEAQAAVFPNATDKVIFTRALSDITSQDATVRADAAKTMAGVRHELSVKALVAQMASESSAQVRQECIKALAALEMKEALPAVKRALTDEAGSVRLVAVWGLYHLAGTESAPALIRMFYDEDEEVRRRATTCIGWLGQEELAVELLPLLDDSSVSVGRAAVEAMGSLRSRQTVSALIERLSDPDVSIRKAVLGALKTITGKQMSGPFPRDEKSLQRLIARWQEWWKEELLG